MRRVSLGIAGVIGLAALGCVHAPVLWSPDGRWLAYTMAVRTGTPVLAPGWLFNASRAENEALEPPRPGLADGLTYRLWASRAENGESVLLEDSRGPLTAPSWSPDGLALAFGRLVPEQDGRGRFEVVLQEAPDRQRVVLSRPINEFQIRAGDLTGVALAWSPDGRYLAVPLVQQTLSLGIVRADNGRVLKIIDDAYLPAWSPDGTKLAFIQGSDAETLNLIDLNFGPPRQLAEIGQTSQAPIWYRDSRSVAVLARRPTPPARRGEAPSQQIDLLRVHIESGRIELVTTLVNEPGDRDKAYNGSSFSFDRDGDELFHVSDIQGQLTEITCYRPRTGDTSEKFHPIDPLIRIGALAVAPGGKLLALRFGSPGDLSTPALLDRGSKKLTPLVPDDASRLEWIATLVRTAQALLRAALPTTDARNVLLDRPTLLPVPGELPLTSDVAPRLRRLGRIGRALCVRPESAPTPGPAPELLDVLAEARLFFDMLCEDYPAALASLDALEPRLRDRDQRVRLLGVRAQIFLGLKQFEQAGQTIAFLRSTAARSYQRIEQTPTGLALVAEPGLAGNWPGYLDERLADLKKVGPGAGAEHNPLGHRNPDNPNGIELLPEPPGAPIPFVPMIHVAPPFMPLLPEFQQPPPVNLNRAQPPAGRDAPPPPPRPRQRRIFRGN